MHATERAVVLGSLLVLLTACGGDEGPHRSDKIVYSSHLTGVYKLYEMSPTGSGVHLLTSGLWDDIAATVSPDGEQVAFLTKQYGVKNQLAVLTLATGAVARIVPDTFAHGAPSWSPDGEWIAFERGGALMRVHPSGTDLTPMGVTGSSPSWSPTGDRMVYAAGTSLRLIDSSGAHDTLLITLTGAASQPRWSAAAGLIAFRGPGGILLVSPSGTGLDTVPYPGHFMSNLAWSEDGTWLYGSTNIDSTCCAPNYEIARFRTDGTGWTRITFNGDNSGGAADDWPTWGSLVSD